MARRTRDDTAVEPLSADDIRLFGSKIEAARSDTQSAAQECASLYKSFESNGGHKGGMQFAMRLKKLGDEKGQAFMRAILHYAPILGLMPREDLVDMAQAGGEDDIDASPAPQAKAPAKPKAEAKPKASAKPKAAGGTHASVSTVENLKARRAAAAADRAARDLAQPSDQDAEPSEEALRQARLARSVAQAIPNLADQVH
jgi:hypothetical protein